MISDSYECTKSELDLFSVPPTQTSIEEGVWDTIKPHSNFSSGTLRFDIPSTSSHYINLADTELYLSVKITKKDSTTLITDTDRIGPVNNFFIHYFLK